MQLPSVDRIDHFSSLIETEVNTIDSVQKNRYLFGVDTSEGGVVTNADLFEIDLQSIDAMILSRGHFDHFTGLQNVATRISRPIKLYAHPDAFLKHWDIYPDGTKLANPVLDEAVLNGSGITVQRNEAQTGLPDERIPWLVITGQIP